MRPRFYALQYNDGPSLGEGDVFIEFSAWNDEFATQKALRLTPKDHKYTLNNWRVYHGQECIAD